MMMTVELTAAELRLVKAGLQKLRNHDDRVARTYSGVTKTQKATLKKRVKNADALLKKLGG